MSFLATPRLSPFLGALLITGLVATTGCGAADSGDGCTQMVRLGDMLDSTDQCWEPPEHYCSGGAGGAVTRACSPDLSTCCDFGTTCIPCGWSACLQAGCLPGDTCPDMPAPCQVEHLEPDPACMERRYFPTMDPFCSD